MLKFVLFFLIHDLRFPKKKTNLPCERIFGKLKLSTYLDGINVK